MNRVYNFAAGPAMLPESVLRTAQADMLDWRNSGMSVMEISHRSAMFETLLNETSALLRDLMAIPKNYHILFCTGGARAQFSMIPMNLLAQNDRANYCVTGNWSYLAMQEAQKYGQIHCVFNTDDIDLISIPDEKSWSIDNDARYFYYTPNETLVGLEFPDVPQVSMPIVADMTSYILSSVIDVSKFGLIYASAQKNLGQAGVTLVIIRDDLITQPFAFTPTMYDYACYRDNNSLQNTAPTYAIYIMNLVLQNLKNQGGVAVIEKMNQEKSRLLYAAVDNSNGFYVNKIDPKYRSRLNVSFNLPTEMLEKKFLEQANSAGLVGLKGHKKVGGIRASLYNAMPLAGVEALVSFMQQFSKEQG
jgi:phosphoserine aminotransferase